MKMMSALFLATIISLMAASPAPAQELGGKRPNIVVMLTDDQRWDAVGFVQQKQNDGRFPFLKGNTPSIDSIANSGVWFTNAFTVDSLCSPSRAAFLTGTYNHTNGIVNNSTPLPLNAKTYATILHDVGYRTGFFGKWHMGTQRERPGFDVVASFVDQGQYVDCPLIVNGVDTPTTGWVDDVTTTYAVDFIRKSASGPRPFLMVLGFKTAHGPYNDTTSPEATEGLFGTVQIDTPRNATSYPPYFTDPAPSTFGGDTFRNYFRAIVGMDRNVGRVLAALEETSLVQNTVVVFASDNGFHMREHGSISPRVRDGEKRSAYEASIRIPLFVRYPHLTRAGTTVPATVLNVDLAPTLLQLAGLPVSPGMQGKSWVPLLDGTQKSVRSGFFYEYFRNRDSPVVPRIKAFRRDGLKLIEYPDYPEYGREFYDLRSDPWERTNRIADPAVQNQVSVMSRAMADAAAKLGYRIPLGADRQR